MAFIEGFHCIVCWHGETEFLCSILFPSVVLQSLDESVSTGTLSPPAPVIADHTPKEVESLQAELAAKEQELARLKEEVWQGRVEGEDLRAEMATLKDKLNVSEVCFVMRVLTHPPSIPPSLPLAGLAVTVGHSTNSGHSCNVSGQKCYLSGHE